MIDRHTFFVFGKTIDGGGRYTDLALAVAAYSSKFRENECVDKMSFARAGTHFGLNLPDGDFILVALADIDRNGIFDQSEVVGQKKIDLSSESVPEKILGSVDIDLTEPFRIEWIEEIVLPERGEARKSLFYPAGTIRTLDDPIFDNGVATLGMYDPASFLETAPTMFYTLEEEFGQKIPVIFVHGIGGGPRAFAPIIEHLDRSRYKPWFFYYPSGGDLDQLADFFYKMFFSGKIIPATEMPMIVVAHSMGGLIVREALNSYNNLPSENKVELLFTIATPFGGHPAAATGEKHGLIVLPAWRDVNPDSKFLRELYRRPLPKSVKHHLLYAYNNPETLKLSANSDGVVPLSSQLYPEAQKQSQAQFGFNSSHTAILEDEEVIAYMFKQMDRVDNPLSEAHLNIIKEGGYDYNLGEEYSKLCQFLIRHYGKYYLAITYGMLEPLSSEQKHFRDAARGKVAATSEVEKGWCRFLEEHPEIMNN